MDWLSQGPGWPNSEYSRFVTSRDARFHVQQMGAETGKPHIVLLHGSGATTHSYGELMPHLAERFSVTALDLPGHGFSSRLKGGRPTIERVSSAIAALLAEEEIAPDMIVGHSAGAAIAVQMVASQGVSTKALVSINGAFYPFPGLAASVFPMAAKALFLNPLVPSLFSLSAGNRRRVERLIASTGSALDAKAIGYYRTAMMSSRHIDGTLAMMAHWELLPMANLLRRLDLPVLQIIGETDGTIDPAAATKTAALLKHGTLNRIAGRGHLVHEEVPQMVADQIVAFAEGADLLASSA